MPLTQQNIESELSYSYLHAVTSRAGMNCQAANRHADNYAIDAMIEYFAPIPGSYRSDVSLRVQLKATVNRGSETIDHISYTFKGIDQYDRLRTNYGEPHRILVVLFLPVDPNEWLLCSPDELIMKDAAYWVSLYGAEATTNSSSVTIYLPKSNLLKPESLEILCQEIGKGNIPKYNLP